MGSDSFDPGEVSAVRMRPRPWRNVAQKQKSRELRGFLASPRDPELTPPIVWESEIVLRPRWRKAV